MQKKSMYFDVNNTKICKNHYQSAGFLSLIKNIWAVLLVGESPINHPSNRRRRH